VSAAEKSERFKLNVLFNPLLHFEFFSFLLDIKMFLYGLTLQPSSSIHTAVYGNFSGSKAHEIVASKGHLLELLRYEKT
jgi:hypothetical protein